MITIEDIEKARSKIEDIAHITPVMTSETLSEQSGNELYLKCEHLQKTGAFKIRGATNKVKNVASGGATHIVTASSGNHGQAVAYIGQQLGIRATIVVPEDAAAVKVNAIQHYGAHVIYCGTTSKERLRKAEELVAEEDAVFIPPYDDPLIMAGQGTVGLEILDQVPEVDLVYVPIGGGGLISGIVTAIKETNPDVQVVGVEPENANDTHLSMKRGEIVPIDPPQTMADGLRTLQPGDQTFPVMKKYLDGIVLVSEDDIKHAFTFLLERMKQLIEPSGAVSVAAAMNNQAGVRGKKVVSVASGGNVPLDHIQRLLHG